MQGRNDIVLNSKKVAQNISYLKNTHIIAYFILSQISGSAFKINIGKTDGSNRKTLHHGTMLLGVDGSAVQKYLNPNKKKLESKGIDSVIQRIMNLNEVLPEINHKMLCDAISQSFQNHYQSAKV